MSAYKYLIIRRISTVRPRRSGQLMITLVELINPGQFQGRGGHQARKSYHTWRSRSIFQKWLKMLQNITRNLCQYPKSSLGMFGELWRELKVQPMKFCALRESGRMAGNLNYRQTRQEAHQISGRNLLPGLPVIQISCHSSKFSKRAKLHWLNFQLSPQLPTYP